MNKTNFEEIDKPQNLMLKVGGKPFYCDCGCNVFHHPGTDINKYECNSCSAVFTAD